MPYAMRGDCDVCLGLRDHETISLPLIPASGQLHLSLPSTCLCIRRRFSQPRLSNSNHRDPLFHPPALVHNLDLSHHARFVKVFAPSSAPCWLHCPSPRACTIPLASPSSNNPLDYFHLQLAPPVKLQPSSSTSQAFLLRAADSHCSCHRRLLCENCHLIAHHRHAPSNHRVFSLDRNMRFKART
eukprot:6081951-Pleurochrysis_carterae.AAC.2